MAATAAGAVKRGRARAKQELERAVMEREDARALCTEQQCFVQVCTAAEARQQRQAARIAEWAGEIEKWRKEKREDKEKIKRLEDRVKVQGQQQEQQQAPQSRRRHGSYSSSGSRREQDHSGGKCARQKRQKRQQRQQRREYELQKRLQRR